MMTMAAMLASLVALASCGKKGPPLAPLRLVPAPVSELTVRRVGPDVQLRFKLPTANANGPGRIDLDRVEVYAVTVAPGSATPANRDLLTKTYLVGTIPVKPLPVEGEDQPAPEGAPPDTRPGPGDQTSFVEELTEARMAPAKLPKAPVPPTPVPALPPIAPLSGDAPLPGVLEIPGTETLPPVPLLPEPGSPTPPASNPAETAAAQAEPAAAGAAAAPAPVQTTIVRVYTLRGVSASGRPGQPSTRVTIPLVPPPPPPSGVKTSFTEKSVAVEWTPPAGDHTGSALAFNVYRVPDQSEPPAKPEPAAKPGAGTGPDPSAKLEAPLNSSPLATARFEMAGLEVGARQCFAIRSVELVQNVAVEGDATTPACVTPKDIFPPAAPQGLSLLLLDGAIELVWDASAEPDAAGYTVLRADAPGETLRPLTPSPIRETTFRDTTVQSGAHYTYAIVAVDRAGNASPPSARVEGTAR
jgi:predicted small lipoprotein YifL